MTHHRGVVKTAIFDNGFDKYQAPLNLQTTKECMRYLETHEKTVIFTHKNKKDKHFDPTFVLAIFSF